MKVFFSFYYRPDHYRASQVVSSWLANNHQHEAAGFVETAAFEEVEREGIKAVKRWIDEQLEGTSVTVILIGADSNTKPYIKYALQKSWEQGNGMVGIYIHQLKDQNGHTAIKGNNTFGPIFKSNRDDKLYFWDRFKTYDWVEDYGNSDFAYWIDLAARRAEHRVIV